MSAKARFVVPDHEKAMRAAVIEPQASVFLGANAGSGKTTILTDRVIRLLLEGANPASILCVTYTKAAAAEMQNRIFERLARWVRLDEAALADEITQLTGRPPGPAALMRARQLFALAVETPGGLKLQTIHAFAERLLHLFPFEANVPARFSVMDDGAKLDLIETAKRGMIRQALTQPEGDTGQAFARLAAFVGEDSLDALINASLPLYSGADVGGLTGSERRDNLAVALGLAPGTTHQTLLDRILALPFGPALWSEAAAAITAGSKAKTDLAKAKLLQAALASGDRDLQRSTLVGMFEIKSGAIAAKPLTEVFLRGEPDLSDAIEATKLALPALRDQEKALEALDRSGALMTLLDDVQTRFRAAKQSRALVDFDDIIQRTLALVKDEGAAWVMRKLDSSIDHVLVDEAQDTTPAMWTIVAALTHEFFAGAGARPGGRSVFAVGDEKQSIYSFQGAKPQAFADHRALFAKRAVAAEKLFLDKELKLSFRTVDDILQAVDRTFSTAERRQGLSSDHAPTVHETARAGAPGFVDLWPLEQQVETEARDAWEEVDAVGHQSAQVNLANRLARHIGHLIASGRHEDDGAPVRAGDIMVLVQRRTPFFDAVIRALKRSGVPVAGADRLRLTEEQGVLDLVIAAKAALLPEDDLTLATVLKSPLIGLDDADLIRLAPGRTGSLFAALSASPEAAHAAATQQLLKWRDMAREMTPFAFFCDILGPQGGRRKLLERLGPDAADGLDMYLQSVLARESVEAPSLVHEVEVFAAMTGNAKRDQDHAGNVVRVMTVHGAKGLEARIVYLPDSQQLPNLKGEGSLFSVAAPLDPERRVILSAGKKETIPNLLAGMQTQQKAGKMDEYRRLLYVAMTRARDRLIIAGWGNPDKLSSECWYAMTRAALAEVSDTITDDAAGIDVLRFRSGDTPAHPPQPQQATLHMEKPLPAWLRQAAPADPVVRPPIRPSHAISAPDYPVSAERETAMLRGDAIHLLLDHLPAVALAERADVATRLLKRRWPRLTDDAIATVISEATGILDTPDWSGLFGPGSRGEVDIAGEVTLPNGQRRRVAGRIDRVFIGPDRILVADFKTGTPPAEGLSSPAHATQLALYRSLLASLWPDRPVVAVLVWTRAGRADVLDPARLAQSLTLL